MDKLFSIVSPCYNGAKYLPDYLDSVFSQSYHNIELILVDDASTDDTVEIAQSYHEKFNEKGYKLIIKKLKRNSGQAAAINKALPLVRGEIMMWMDADDILLPQAIEKKVGFLDEHPEFDYCLNQGYIVNEDDINKIAGVLKREKPTGDDNLFEDLIYERNVVFAPGTICVRSKILKGAIPSLHIYESREGQNWQLMLPLAYEYKYGYIEEPLFKYVIHGDSHSHTKMSYERAIQRLDNFDVLLKETINGISSMPIVEKNEWNDRITIKTLKNMFYTSCSYRQYDDYKKYKELLEKHDIRVTIKDSYFLYPLKLLKSKCKSAINRITRE